jgi:3',5'-cyclic-AMP phosphodiesterase
MAKVTAHPKSRRALRVIQITDTHLYADSNGCLLGLNTEQSLESVIASIRARNKPCDLVLATGDLVHDGTPDAYQRIFSHLKEFGVPVYCLPGNHDEARTLQNTMQNGVIQYVDHACHGNWQFIFLDSTVPGKEGGHMGPETLRALDTHLRSMPETHTLVCLHHQPVMMGSRWLDSMAVDNADDFFAIIDRHPQVRGILWGHVHQQFDRIRKHVMLMATPSTCVQFLPRSTAFAVDDAAPGYRWLSLFEDGSIETGVERLADIPGAVDLASAGY